MQTSIGIKLTPQESRELRHLVRRQKAPYREGVRAQMILMLAGAESFSATSRKVGKARRIVYKWAKRFLAARIDGLKDKLCPRPILAATHCRHARKARSFTYLKQNVPVPSAAVPVPS